MAKGKKSGSGGKNSKTKGSDASSSVRDDLPGSVRRSGKKARETFVEVHSAVLKEHKDPQRAKTAAYEALERGFEKVGDRWKRRDKKRDASSGGKAPRGADAAVPVDVGGPVVSPLETLQAEPPEPAAVMPLAADEPVPESGQGPSRTAADTRSAVAVPAGESESEPAASTTRSGERGRRESSDGAAEDDGAGASDETTPPGTGVGREGPSPEVRSEA